MSYIYNITETTSSKRVINVNSKNSNKVLNEKKISKSYKVNSFEDPEIGTVISISPERKSFSYYKENIKKFKNKLYKKDLSKSSEKREHVKKNKNSNKSLNFDKYRVVKYIDKNPNFAKIKLFYKKKYNKSFFEAELLKYKNSKSNNLINNFKENEIMSNILPDFNLFKENYDKKIKSASKISYSYFSSNYDKSKKIYNSKKMNLYINNNNKNIKYSLVKKFKDFNKLNKSKLSNNINKFKNNSILKNNSVLKDKSVLKNNSVLKDKSVLKNNSVLKDQSVLKNNSVLKDQSVSKNNNSLINNNILKKNFYIDPDFVKTKMEDKPFIKRVPYQHDAKIVYMRGVPKHNRCYPGFKEVSELRAKQKIEQIDSKENRWELLNDANESYPLVKFGKEIRSSFDYLNRNNEEELHKIFMSELGHVEMSINGKSITVSKDPKEILKRFRSLLPNISDRKLVSCFAQEGVLAKAFFGVIARYPDILKYTFYHPKISYKINRINENSFEVDICSITRARNFDNFNKKTGKPYKSRVINSYGMKTNVVFSKISNPIIKNLFFIK